jgi:hypothetical protein
MSIQEYAFAPGTAVVSVVARGGREAEVVYDDEVAKVRIGLAPEDEDSGAVVGINIHTRGGAAAVMLIVTPRDASALAWRLARAAEGG